MSARVTLTVKDGTKAGKEYVFADHAQCLIGRADDCDLRLQGSPEYWTVSRHHCLLEITPEKVWVRDLDSLNGTLINGMRIARYVSRRYFGGVDRTPLAEYELKDGDELSVAGILFRVGIVPAHPYSELVVDVPEEKDALAFAEPSVN